MAEQLASHDEVVRSTVEGLGGYVFATGGDGFAAAFATAVDAASAAVAAQRRLDLPVRMGLHSGAAHERDGNFFGSAVNRAARVMAAAHGGPGSLFPCDSRSVGRLRRGWAH